MYLTRGDNGLVIKQGYDGAFRCRVYFTRSKIKKYETFSAAEEAARMHLREILPRFVPLPEKIGLDDLLTIRKLIQEYETKSGHYEGN